MWIWALIWMQWSRVEEQLTVKIDLGKYDYCWWSVPGHSSGGRSITQMLERLREDFDGRVRGPQAIVEEPHTAQEWQAFARRWIFGPPQPKQISLRGWLRPHSLRRWLQPWAA